MGHRYYAYGNGHFLTRDPTGFAGGINLYGFCGNNPINNSDPTGFGYEPIDELVDLGAATYDGYALWRDKSNHASAAQLAVDGTALTLDAVGLIPGAPPGTGEAYRLARGGALAVSKATELYRARRLAQATVWSGRFLSTMASSGGGGNAGADSSETSDDAEQLIYQAGGKHQSEQVGDVAPEPINGQAALDRSVQVKSTSPRRVGVDVENNEIVVLDQTRPGLPIYHGHVRTWTELHVDMRNALVRAGLVTKRGVIIKP